MNGQSVEAKKQAFQIVSGDLDKIQSALKWCIVGIRASVREKVLDKSEIKVIQDKLNTISETASFISSSLDCDLLEVENA